MATKSKFRGHDVEYRNEEWFFCETGLSIIETHIDMPCGHCGRGDTPEGHDGCLGTLPGVMNACCGHGVESEAYIQFSPGVAIYGGEAAGEIHRLKMQVNPPSSAKP